MKQLQVEHDSGLYSISIGEGLRHSITDYLPTSYRQVFVITDSHVAPLYLQDVKNAFSKETIVSSYVVPAGEQSKSLSVFYDCHTKAIENGIDRESLIVALGGGVVGDLAGYVAASYMRGIDYVQVPTTLLAHDSSVGGKVAINHELGKNLIGHFYQPVAVIYDTETLRTLSNIEWRSGMAEVIKHAWIAKDHAFLEQCYKLNSFSDMESDLVNSILYQGIAVKARIVSDDEREQGIRRFLNFGHTLGHAIEAELGYGKVTHGEAVAVGMDFALKVSESYYNADLNRQKFREWISKHNYPIALLDQLNIHELLHRMTRDKKNIQSEIRLVLLSERGKPEVVSFTVDQIREELKEYHKEVS